MDGWDLAGEVWTILFIPMAMIVVLSLAWHALKLSREVVRIPPAVGRHPNKDDPEALRKTIARLKGLRSGYRRGLFLNWAQLGLFGVLLPAMLLFEVCLYVSSVVGVSVFASSEDSWSRANPTDLQAAAYVWDQISSALTLGLFEMWQWKPWTTSIVHDPKAPGVLPILFFFRAIIDFFSGAWIFAGILALWNAAVAKTNIQRRIDQHEGELLIAVQAQVSNHAASPPIEVAKAA